MKKGLISNETGLCGHSFILFVVELSRVAKNSDCVPTFLTFLLLFNICYQNLVTIPSCKKYDHSSFICLQKNIKNHLQITPYTQYCPRSFSSKPESLFKKLVILKLIGRKEIKLQGYLICVSWTKFKKGKLKVVHPLEKKMNSVRKSSLLQP